MQRARQMIGLAVFGPDEKKLGEVTDVIFDRDTRYVRAVVVTGGTVFRRPRYISSADIAAVTAEGLLVRDAECWSADEIGGVSLAASDSPVGKSITTTGGAGVGAVRDVLLEEGTLDVWGFEISDGLVKDILEGTQLLPRQLVERLADEKERKGNHMNNGPNGKPSRGGGERP